MTVVIGTAVVPLVGTCIFSADDLQKLVYLDRRSISNSIFQDFALQAVYVKFLFCITQLLSMIFKSDCKDIKVIDINTREEP